jgi:hypothetical protein
LFHCLLDRLNCFIYLFGAMLGGKKETQPRGALGNRGMNNGLHIDAALKKSLA